MNDTKPIPDEVCIPASFRAGHVHHLDLADMLGIYEQTFWEHYTVGLILPGVPLMRITGQPLLVWPRGDVEAWLASGRPAYAELRERTVQVYSALAKAIEAEYGMSPDQIANIINGRN